MNCGKILHRKGLDDGIVGIGYDDDEFLCAANSSYVVVCSGLAAIFNAKLLPLSIIYVHRIAVY